MFNAGASGSCQGGNNGQAAMHKLADQIFTQDRSLVKDERLSRFPHEPLMQEQPAPLLSAEAMREHGMADAFFQDAPPPPAVHFSTKLPIQQQPDWTSDFQSFQSHQIPPNVMQDMESAYSRASNQWVSDFNQFQPSSSSHPEWNQDMNEAFLRAQEETDWETEFNKAQEWATEFSTTQESTRIDASTDKEALTMTASRLVDILEMSENPKFKQSNFMGFMKRIKEQQVTFKDNKVVEQDPRAINQDTSTTSFNAAESWANEFGTHIQPNNWEEEFQVQSTPIQDEDWSQQFNATSVPVSDQEWAQEFKTKLVLEEPRVLEWETGDTKKQVTSDYPFTLNNPYMEKPIDYLSNPLAHDNITESILALEAAVQKDPTLSSAWYHLGLKQQENENDVAAITALKQACQLDPKGNLGGWLALAVSYANELSLSEAHDAIYHWLQHNPTYSQLPSLSNYETMNPSTKQTALSRILIEAARSQPDALDPDVQIALGILFHMSSDYDKAIDCFEAALGQRPQDYVLWNKLGATLSNAGSTARSLDAYYNALQMNPSYIRARFNLAISCMHLQQYKEAAEHLLGALAIQKGNFDAVKAKNATSGLSDATMRDMHSVSSDSLWSLLKTILSGYLNMYELGPACDERRLEAFEGRFEY